MAELTVRQDELGVTINPGGKRRLTGSGLRKSRSKLLDGLELRVLLVKVVGVHASDSAYWELREQMDALDTTRAAPRPRFASPDPPGDPPRPASAHQDIVACG